MSGVCGVGAAWLCPGDRIVNVGVVLDRALVGELVVARVAADCWSVETGAASREVREVVFHGADEVQVWTRAERPLTVSRGGL